MSGTVIAPVTAQQLRTAVESADAKQVRALLAPYAPGELKHLVKELTTLRAELRREAPSEWSITRGLRATLMVAAMMCVQTPAQAATWLSRGPLFDGFADAVSDGVSLLTLRRDTGWLGELAIRLVERMRQTPDRDFWDFVDALAAVSEAQIPVNAGYAAGWLNAARWQRYSTRTAGVAPPLVDWLRGRRLLRECVLALFEFDGLGSDFVVYPGAARAHHDQWPSALTTLIDEGRLDRAELIEACTARLLRGDGTGSLRGHLTLFEALAPTPDEVRARLGTYQSMATSAASTVSKVAVRELRALDAAQPFDPTDFADFSAAMLTRTENGAVTAHLAWIDAVLKRDPGTAAILLPRIGDAFAHQAAAVQQRALRILAKHLAKADERALAELRLASQSLDPALKPEADALLAPAGAGAGDGAAPGGGGVPTDVPIPFGLPAYSPIPLPPLPATPEELLTAIAPSFARGAMDPLEVEQIMAAVAILSHRDRAGLAAVLRPLAERHRPAGEGSLVRMSISELTVLPSALRSLFHAVLGEEVRKERVRVDLRKQPQVPKTALVLRIQELTDHLLHGPTVPVLLATPTEASGAIDPAVFEERAELYRRQGIALLPFDLEQARLRMAPPPPERRELLDALAAAEVGVPLEPLGMPAVERRTTSAWPRLTLPKRESPKAALSAMLYPPLVVDGKLRFPGYRRTWTNDHQAEFWPTTLPRDPDQIAAHAMADLDRLANKESGEPTTIFPALAETAGTPGPLTHLALAYALAADRPEQRIAAQDALLILAARGLLRPAELGRLAAALWLRDLVRGSRLVEALNQAEQAGAGPEVLAAALAAVSVLARRPETRGLADVLLLATRCALGAAAAGRSVPAAADVPGLSELACAAKPKRVGQEARRLAAALGAHRPPPASPNQ